MFCSSEPDLIGERGENSAAGLQYQSHEEKNIDKNCDEIQVYPFTFIGAVKQKLAVAAKNESSKEIYSTKLLKAVDIQNELSKSKTMEFIKPLKVPDMKISPKSSDYSPRENSNQRNKLTNTPKEGQQKIEKNIKLSLAQRKLDFSESESTSFITNDEIESLKVPNISFSPNIGKKKDTARDSSREKENRLKKFRTNGSNFSKDGDSSDTLKHRNFKHISRKDLEATAKKSKNEKFTSNSSIETELTNSMTKKCQKKLSSSTTVKKDSRSTSSYSGKSRERSLESRGRTFSTESVLDRNSKSRESSRISAYENSLQKSNEDYAQHNRIFIPKEIINKKQLDKSKPSPTKIHSRYVSTNSELSEEIGTASEGNNIKVKIKKIRDNDRKFNIEKASIEPSQELLLLDPRRISFRDESYSKQDEFTNLVTPDLNLVYRPKRKKDGKNSLQISKMNDSHLQSSLSKAENLENDRENDVPLVHPSALHMQFQAELHLFDSYNESLRQVMDVENCLYNAKQDNNKKRDTLEKKHQSGSNQSENIMSHEVNKQMNYSENKEPSDESKILVEKKSGKEVQTQTVNDIATQTEVFRNHYDKSSKFYPGITYNRGEGSSLCDIGHLSLNSIDEFGDLDRLDEISLPSKIRTMSEISLHETTSSIKTETGTEISISTRDVTCSFNKYLDLEMAQLIKDEKHMYDKIEMLFKSREKTLNDRTKKLVELEEQKRALRDTGQDSRISSVKKKQRALLLKLQQEKEEMNRLKELHKLASQERKLMLQKQRNMFNPQMSTKNILNKLKRSADCHSPRRLSGPMKGYDIRSNSSVSSLLDSDKSQLDKSRHSLDKGEIHPPLTSSKITQDSSNNSSQIDSPQKYQVKVKKFEEKMPKSDLLRLKAHYFELGSKFINPRQDSNFTKILPVDDVLAEEKTESDTLVEEKAIKRDNIILPEDIDCGPSKKSRGIQVNEEKPQKNNQTTGEPAKFNSNKKKISKNIKGKLFGNSIPESTSRSNTNLHLSDIDSPKHSKKSRGESDRNFISQLLEVNNCHNSNHQASSVEHSDVVADENKKSLSNVTNKNGIKEMNPIRSTIGEDIHEKAQRNETLEDVQGLGNISTRSQVSTFTISRHSSGDSEKSYSRSVVIRSQDHRFKAPKKLEQVLNAREAAVVSRRNCVEDWISWHARLKAEESRVARMEEAAYKLVSATTNSNLYNDTTLSSDTSDVEGRVELLAEKLSEKRAEMAKLRKEARRQARQRLKALEANLLTQIKKYDTTINEMRKKLDSKSRGSTKQNEKLAIEAKNIGDFKVPEISLKKIQDIYRKSDLLHSRSESDIITGTLKKSSSTELSNNIYECASSMKPLSRSIESVLEEAKKHSSRQSTINEAQTTRLSEENFTDYSEDMENPVILNQTESTSKLRDDSLRSPLSINETKSISNSIPEEIKINNEDSMFSRKIDYLQLNNKNLNNDISNLANDLKTLSEMMSKFSEKSCDKSRLIHTSSASEKEDTESLISIGKSTSKDITEDLLKSDYNETEELKSVDEVIERQSALSFSSAQSEIHSTNSEFIKTTNEEAPSEIISTTICDEISVKIPEVIDFEARSKEILNEIEKSIISEHVKSTPVNNLEVCGAAIEKSLENLQKENVALSSDFNSLEGNIKSISEIISKMTECKDSLDLVVESAQSIDSSNDELIDSSSALSLSQHSSNLELNVVDDDDELQTSISSFKDMQSLEQCETGTLISAPVTNEKRSSEISKSLSHENIENFEKTSVHENDMEKSFCEEKKHSLQDDLDLDSFDSIVKSSEEKHISNKDDADLAIPELFDIDNIPVHSIAEWKNHDDYEGERIREDNEIFLKNVEFSNSTNQIEEKNSTFLPRDQSTIIDGTVFQVENTRSDEIIKSQEAQTDELDDIIDIIEKDSRKLQESPVIVALDVPDELKLEIKENSVPQLTNDLNLTADVEPVLQKLTEILINVEKNIAKKAEEKKTPSLLVADGKELQVEENVDISYENLMETDIDKKSEVNDHLDEALNQLTLEEEKEIERRKKDELRELVEEKKNDVNDFTKNISELEDNDRLNVKITRIPDTIKDPEYEDISEESLEVSEILDKSESQRSGLSTRIPDNYQVIEKTDEVLRILDEISQKSLKNRALIAGGSVTNDIEMNFQVFENIYPEIIPGIVIEELNITGNENESIEFERNNKKMIDDFKPMIDEKKLTQEYSDGGETTPREISEIDSNSPREQNDSRLDIDGLDDDLLGTGKSQIEREKSEKINFPSDNEITTSEKDIELMIDKLRASLHQPGLEVAELDARLLRIEQLQIELQIKKLEAEEVSFFAAREIPNKPPPPYTPPRGVRLSSSSQSSLNLPPAVVPSNVDELTALTEKATAIIYNAKCIGEEIISLEAPMEILEANKETNEISKRDRKIYNTFLFDLCKETIADIYHSEYEKAGPSWTKPSVRTKPAIKIPKNVQELTEYVNKEVATLFGFKTKLQRENMVMRWSRKRRDRVDELLAREAQAEEDEWTKFHHDELAVKNELTLAILDTLIMETTGVIKDAFSKKLNICI